MATEMAGFSSQITTALPDSNSGFIKTAKDGIQNVDKGTKPLGDNLKGD